MDIAKQKQEDHLPDDSWNDLICNEVRKDYDYCQGSVDYSITVPDIYSKVFPNDSLSKISRNQEMRIINIFRNELGLYKERRMLDGKRFTRWYINPIKAKELQDKNIKPTDEGPFGSFDKK